jgi:endo-alpha-1,4-polygalactosaminidase (GH114 family)
MEGKKAPRRSWSLRRKLLVGALLTLTVLALALGLGLGLTLGRDSGDDSGDDNGNPPPTSTTSPLPSPTARPLWTPKVNDTWQIVLQSGIQLDADATSITPNVSIFDIDLFTTSKETIDTLHRLGKKVICYFSAGSYEPGRPDSSLFQEADMGKGLDGWPGERWLKLSSPNVQSIMKDRIQLAYNKSCDGIDPDNVDGYQNTNGLDLTPQDAIDFISYLSNVSVPLNLTMGLKNAGDIIPAVIPIVHFSVNEQCVENKECETFAAFIKAGKPVFHIEYPDKAGQELKANMVEKFCGEEGDDGEGSVGFSTVLKKMDLDGWVEYCDGQVETTPVSGTD